MSSYPITGELYAAGYRWREEFETPEKFAANGGESTGSPTIDDGIVIEAGITASFPHATWTEGSQGGTWLVAEFTPNFAANEAVTRILCRTPAGDSRFVVQRRSTGQLDFVIENTFVKAAAFGDWSPYWRQGERNVLIASFLSGKSDFWLNGNMIGFASAVAFTPGYAPDTLYVGTNVGGGDEWLGTIRRIHFGRGTLEESDVDHLTAGTLITAIAPSTYRLALPCAETYLSGGDTVTAVVGTTGIDEAILGAGAAEPGGPYKRSFIFDGVDDTLTIGASEDLQLLGDGGDEPFTLGFLVRPISSPTALRHVLGIASGPAAGAWYVAYDGSNHRLHFRSVDDTAGAYIGRSAVVGSAPLPRRQFVVATDEGLGTAAGLRIYDRSGRIDAADDNSGVYVRRRAVADPLLFGGPGGAYAPLHCDSGLLLLRRGLAASPMQAAILAYRLQRYSSTPAP
jgi:hypothetical protein